MADMQQLEAKAQSEQTQGGPLRLIGPIIASHRNLPASENPSATTHIHEDNVLTPGRQWPNNSGKYCRSSHSQTH